MGNGDDKARLSRFDVLALVLARPGITSLEIARSTGATVNAIDAHLHRLCLRGEIVKTRLPPGNRARYAYSSKNWSPAGCQPLAAMVVQLEERLVALYDQRNRLTHEITVLEETVERLSPFIEPEQPVGLGEHAQRAS